MRFIWGLALTRVSITGWCVLWRYTYFFCAWQRVPSRGWPTMWLILPYIYSNLILQLEYSHFFFKGIPQLGYFLALSSHPCHIWIFTWGLRSVLEGPFISQCIQRFQRGFQSGHQLFLIIPARAGFYVLSYLLRCLCSYHQVFDCTTPCLAALMWYIAFPSVSCDDRG